MKPKIEANPAVPLSFLASPTATPTANSKGRFPNMISPTFFIIVNIAVTTGMLTNAINGW